MDDIVWQDPTPTPGRPSRYDDLAFGLRAHPYKWALAGTFATYSAVTRIRRALGPEFEVRSSRDKELSAVHVWARFVG